MSALTIALDDYLSLRRSLGYKLERPGELLADFVATLDRLGADRVTVELAVDWAMRAPNPASSWRAQRLGVVRGFARYLRTIDPTHQVPPPGLLPRGQRLAPFLYAPEDIVALMTAAQRLQSPLRALTAETIIGLVAVTGMFSAMTLAPDRS